MISPEKRKIIDGVLAKNDYKPAVYQASFSDPDKQAEIMALAESRMLPEDTVERNLPELHRQARYDSFDLDQEVHPKTSKYFSDYSNSRVSIDDVDALKGLEATVDDMENGFLSNSGRLLLDNINKVTGNFLQLYGNLEEGLDSTLKGLGIPNPGITFGDDGVSFHLDVPAGAPSQVGKVGEAVSSEGSAYGYVPRFTWEKFKGDMTVSNLIGFAGEQGIGSLGEMVAAVYALPAYIGSRTQEMAESRVKNDERKEVEGSDLVAALPVAVAAAMLEKFGAKFVFGGGKPSAFKDYGGYKTDYLKAAVLSKGEGGAVSRAASAGASGFMVEGGTEVGQTTVEYFGTTLGTKKKVSAGELLDQQLQSFAAGSVFGGGLSVASSTLQTAAGNLINKNVSVNAQSMSEQETIDKLVSFSQSSTTRGRKLDRFKAFMETLNTQKQVFISNESITDALDMGIELPSYITDQLDGPLTDITVSVQDFTTDLAGNEELMGVIREHVKLNPHTLTQAEFNDTGDPSTQALIEKASRDKQLLTESEQIYNDVKDQIVDTERQGEQTAKYSAALFPAWAAEKAKQLGKRPKEIYAMMGLEVVSDKITPEVEKTASGHTYEQDFGDIQIKEKRIYLGKKASIEMPAQKAWNRNIKRRKLAEKLRGCING